MSRRQIGTLGCLRTAVGPRGRPWSRRAPSAAAIRQLWDEGRGHTGDGSAWEAFQAAVEFIDHAPAAVRGEDTAEKRALGLYDGAPGQIKQRIARNLFAYASADEAGQEALVFG